MNMTVKPPFDLHSRHTRKVLVFISLLIIVILVSSLFICTFVNSSRGSSLENAVHVKTETELKNAINNTPDGKPTTIAIDNDITLTTYNEKNHTYNYYVATLAIPAYKDITLTSNKVNGFYKLISAVNTVDTIIIGAGGVLRLDGVIVTHKSGVFGRGIHIMRDGCLYLYSGEISGNTVDELLSGGGVANGGTFIMSGGKITGNSADFFGGGVLNDCTFVMSGGAISGNTVGNGGGVYNSYYGKFTMSGGEISGNTATYQGGGVYLDEYTEFTMSGGEISGNTATYQGGGVYSPSYSNGPVFNRQGGVISGNTASEGSDVYPDSSKGGSDGGFSLKDIVITCVIATVVTICFVLVVLHSSSKKKNRTSREKNLML